MLSFWILRFKQNSRLFPRVFKLADVQQKLRQMLKPVDAHPKVIELSKMPGIPWSVDSI